MRPVDVNKVFEVVRPVVEGQGYDLVEVEWKHENGNWVLRVFIDLTAEAADAAAAAGVRATSGSTTAPT